MRPFPIEELVDRVGSRFTVVVAAAKRAKQLKDGAPPLVSLPTRNALTIALHEIATGLIQIGDAPEIPEEVAARAEEPAELAAPEVVEAVVKKAAARGKKAKAATEASDLDEEIADDLEEDDELEDEEETEEEEEEEELEEEEEEE